jgi:hypothetical protein
VRVWDGALWSAPATVTMTTVTNNAPVVTGNDVTYSGPSQQGDISLSNQFGATDADGDPITQVEIKVPSRLTWNGTVNSSTEAGGTTDILANSLDNISVHFAAGSDAYTLSARAFDGVSWGNWVDSSVTILQPDHTDDTIATARPLTLSATPQTIRDWLSTSYDTSDNYHFTLPDAATVHLQINGLSTDQTVQASLLTEDGHIASGGGNSPPYMFGNFANSAAPLSKDVSMAAGSYVLQLNAYSPDAIYNLTVSAS